jgi:hypothetical protein
LAVECQLYSLERKTFVFREGDNIATENKPVIAAAQAEEIN